MFKKFLNYGKLKIRLWYLDRAPRNQHANGVRANGCSYDTWNRIVSRRRPSGRVVRAFWVS